MTCRFMSVTLLTSRMCRSTAGKTVPGVGYRMVRISGKTPPLCSPIADIVLVDPNHGYWLALTRVSLNEAYAINVPSSDGHRAMRSWRTSSVVGKGMRVESGERG